MIAVWTSRLCLSHPNAVGNEVNEWDFVEDQEQALLPTSPLVLEAQMLRKTNPKHSYSLSPTVRDVSPLSLFRCCFIHGLHSSLSKSVRVLTSAGEAFHLVLWLL